MTPQESQLVDDLFDRLAQLESAPRDAAAERLIGDGLQRAPHAVYALVQTALVQDEALKRANARIEELQAQTDNAEAVEQRPASFLDTMREALTGHAPRGSVPNVRPQNVQSQASQSPNLQPQASEPQPGYPPAPPPGYPGNAPLGSGGSFLGSAASTAAGVVGGSLLLNGIRSMFGHHAGGFGQGSSAALAGESPSPWRNKADQGGANSDLARDLGADRVGKQDVKGNDQQGDVESVTETDDDYDPDDNDDGDDDDFDVADADDDSDDM